MHTNAALYVINVDLSLLKLTSKVLREVGYQVEEFSTGEEFLEFEISKPVGCVITELCLPGVSATEIQAELVRRRSTLALIVTSAVINLPTMVQLMRRGATTILEQPIAREELISAVQEGITQSRFRSDNSEHWELESLLAQLTDSEMSVLRCLLKGLSRKVISSTLGISPRSVDRRRQTVLQKMKVLTLLELSTKISRVTLPCDRLDIR